MHKTIRTRFLSSYSDKRKSKIGGGMKHIVGLLAIFVTLAACGEMVEAQQPKKVHRIGFLSAGSGSSMAAPAQAFLLGLQTLGYVEGKNILIEYRAAEGKNDRLPDLVAELIR